jgi:hypothetical protein
VREAPSGEWDSLGERPIREQVGHLVKDAEDVFGVSYNVNLFF